MAENKYYFIFIIAVLGNSIIACGKNKIISRKVINDAKKIK